MTTRLSFSADLFLSYLVFSLFRVPRFIYFCDVPMVLRKRAYVTDLESLNTRYFRGIDSLAPA